VAALTEVGCRQATVDTERSRITIPVCDAVADLMAALRHLDQAGITPRDLGLRRPSLDDVFLALTGRNTADEDSEPASATGRRTREPAASQP
jgi:ABC-2 type transport system ATP-binding protein